VIPLLTLPFIGRATVSALILSMALVSVGLAGPIAGASEIGTYYDWAYVQVREDTTEDDWTRYDLEAGDTLVQPFVSTVSGRAVSFGWTSFGAATTTVSITDASNTPAPGQVLGSETVVASADPDGYAISNSADFYDENVALAEDEQYVWSLTVQEGATSVYLIPPEHPDLAPDAQILVAGTDTWVTPRGNAAWAAGILVESHDSDLPLIDPVLFPAEPDGENGWYVSPVEVGFRCTDRTSWITDCLGFGDGVLHASTLVSATATDAAGNTAELWPFEVKVDLDNPELYPTSDPQLFNKAGWAQGPVMVFWICADEESGIQDCPEQILVSEWTELSATATDMAGNEATFRPEIQIDGLSPDVWIPRLTAGESFTTRPALKCKADDPGEHASGVSTCIVNWTKLRPHRFRVAAVATDIADNKARTAYRITIDPDR